MNSPGSICSCCTCVLRQYVEKKLDSRGSATADVPREPPAIAATRVWAVAAAQEVAAAEESLKAPTAAVELLPKAEDGIARPAASPFARPIFQ